MSVKECGFCGVQSPDDNGSVIRFYWYSDITMRIRVCEGCNDKIKRFEKGSSIIRKAARKGGC